jgi:hypothetical protein
LNILKTVIVQKADQIQWTIMGYCLFLYDCSCIIIWVCCSCCSCPSVDTFVSVQQWFFAQKGWGIVAPRVLFYMWSDCCSSVTDNKLP